MGARSPATSSCLARSYFRRVISVIAAVPFVDELGEPEPPSGHVRKHRLHGIGRCMFSAGQAIGCTPAVPVGSGCGLAPHADNPKRDANDDALVEYTVLLGILLIAVIAHHLAVDQRHSCDDRDSL